MTDDAGQPEAAPLLRVVRGRPSDAELAALVTVLAAASGPPPAPPAPRTLWNDPALLLQGSAMPSSAAWTSAARPR